MNNKDLQGVLNTLHFPHNNHIEVSNYDLNNLFSCLDLSEENLPTLLDEIAECRARNNGKLLSHDLARIIRELNLKTKAESLAQNQKKLIQYTANDF